MITKFSRMGRLPHFLSHGAPPTRGAKRPARGAPLRRIHEGQGETNFVSYNLYDSTTFA